VEEDNAETVEVSSGVQRKKGGKGRIKERGRRCGKKLTQGAIQKEYLILKAERWKKRFKMAENEDEGGSVKSGGRDRSFIWSKVV